ncbi:MAG: helix-turn-helix domain-containing protein, partial [Gaiellaceae bacterium]
MLGVLHPVDRGLDGRDPRLDPSRGCHLPRRLGVRRQPLEAPLLQGAAVEGRLRLRAGPTEADGVCTLRARDIRRILQKEFGVEYSLAGVYDLLHRLGFSCLAPRPRHRKNDLAQMQHWIEQAPLLSKPRPSSTPAGRSKSGSKT